ncbi:MAG: hypothetical protein GHCLOJNM_04057 [bacterium]|nr:hypothetical protein [bacterium]
MNASMSSCARARACWPLAVILAPIALARLVGLDEESFWLDEAKGVTLAFAPLEGWWRELPNHHAPPGHFILLRWVGALSVEDFALRLPSALSGVLALLLFWRLTSRLAQGGVALTALAWLVFSPLLFHYSREARPYALWVLAELAVTQALFLQDPRNPRPERLTLLGLLLPLPLLLHYQALWFLVGRLPALACLTKAWRREQCKAFGPALLFSAALAAPWLGRQIASMPPPNPRVLASAADWSLTSIQRHLEEFFGLPHPYGAGTWVLLGLAVVGLSARNGTRGQGRAWFPRSVWILSLVIPPIGIVASVLIEERYIATRHFLPLLPMLLLEAAKGLHFLVEKFVPVTSSAPRRGRRIRSVYGMAGAVPCLLWGGILLGDYRRIDHPPCREIARFLAEEHLPGRAFVAVGDNVSVLDYYRRTRHLTYPLFLHTVTEESPAPRDGTGEVGPIKGHPPTEKADVEIQGIVVAGVESGGREWRETLARREIRPSRSWASRTISPVEYYPLPPGGGRLLVEGMEQEVRSHP